MIKINLLPPDYQTENLFSLKSLYTIISVGFILIFSSLYVYGHMKINDLNQELQTAKNSYCLFEATIKRKEAMDNNKIIIKAKNNILIEVSKENVSWYAILVHLGNLATDDVWLKEINLTNKNELFIKGNMTSYPHLLEFIDKFSNDTLFAIPDLANSTVANNKENLSEFEIIAKIKEM